MNEYSDMFAQEVEQFRKVVTGDVETTNAKTPSTESKSNYSAEDYAESIDGGGVKYSISITADNRPVVVINDDISRYANNDKDLVDLVKKSLGRFKKVPIKEQAIHFLRDTKNEYTNSKYTKYIRYNKNQTYVDKMRLAAHPQDIIYATTNYINEGLKHSRKDNIIDFARGDILIDVLGQKYKAEVVVGFTDKGICELHDVVNILPTNFNYKNTSMSNAIDLNTKSARIDILANDTVSQKDISVNTHSMQNPEKDTQIKLSAVSTKEKQRYNEIASKYKKGDTISAEDEKILSDIVKKAAKEKMSDTKVVDDDGLPKEMYHGTNNRNEKETWNPKTKLFETEYSKFTIFKKVYDEQNGFFFADNYDNAGGYGSTVYRVFLNSINPLVIECDNQNYNAIEYEDKVLDTYEWAEFAKKNKFDGVIFKNISDGVDYNALSKPIDVCVVFNSNQIKSADPITYDDNGNPIPIEKRFDEGKRDIRFSASKSSKITKEDVEAIQSIKNDDGTPKSVNDFTSEDIKKTEAFAKRYFNEIGNKSPFFRAWFGDWKAYDKSKVFVPTIKDSQNYPSEYSVNNDTNIKAFMGSLLKSETYTHSKNKKSNKLRMLLVKNASSLFNNAILLDSVTSKPNENKSKNTIIMHSFYGFEKYDNNLYLYKMFVEEYLNDGNVERRGYEVKDIKISPVTSKGSIEESTFPQPEINGDEITVSQLFNLVKQYDKNFNPKSVNPILLEKDGTPKKFYHGTNAKFTVFDNNKGGLSLVSNALYFTKDRNRAEAYSEHYDNDLDKSVKGYVMEVYLKSDNPVIIGEADKQVKNIPVEVREKYKDEFDIEQDAELYGYAILDFAKFVAQKENRTQIEMLQEWGFDGAYNGVDYAVFEPTQIKSATDNIGTFDKDNPDIRFSTSKKSQNNIANVQNKGYNDSEQYGTMWTLEDNVLDKNEVSAFYDKISEMHNNGYKNYEMSNNGEYVFEVGNKVIYCDGNYDNPEIFEVVGFKTNDANLIAGGMEMLKFGEENGFENTQCDELIECVLGEGNVSRANIRDSKAYSQWQEFKRKRTNSRTPNNRSGEDVKLSATPKKSYAEQFETQDLIRMIADDIGYHEGLIEASKKNKEEFVALAKSNESLTKRLESAKTDETSGKLDNYKAEEYNENINNLVTNARAPENAGLENDYTLSESGELDGYGENDTGRKLGRVNGASQDGTSSRMDQVGHIQSKEPNTPHTRSVHRSGVSAEVITSSGLTTEQAQIKAQNELEGVDTEFFVEAKKGEKNKLTNFTTDHTAYFPNSDFERNDIVIKDGVVFLPKKDLHQICTIFVPLCAAFIGIYW